MRKITLLSSFLFFLVIVTNAQTTNMRFGADFTGSPASYTFTSTDVAHPTSSTFSTSSNNLCVGASRRTQISSIILRLVSTSAGTISIQGQSSGSTQRTLTKLETASSLAGTFTEIPAANYTTSSTISSSSTCGTLDISGLTIPVGTYIKFTFSGNINVSGFDVTAAASGTPSTQATNVNFTNIAQTAMTINWTRGNGSNVAVFVKQGAGAITNPTDGVDYTANAVFGTGTQLGSSGYYCVYNGNASSVNVTGLTTSTTYYVQVFEFNGVGATTKYLTTTATNNPNSQTTAAPPSDYRSNGSGDWSNTAIWETYNGSAWIAATSAPDLAAANITVRNGHTINITANLSLDEITIENGAAVNINGGANVTIANGTGTDVTLNGTIKNIGTFTLASGATMNVGATGVYEDAQPATAGTITIPTATWANGSTFVLSGLIGVAATDYIGLQGVKQSFSNFKINTPNLLTKLLLTRNGGTSAPYMEITGTLTVDATGTGSGIQILSTGNNNNTLVVGNYVQNGGNVQALHNAGSAATRNVTVLGNFTLTNNAVYDIANTTGTTATNITYTNIGGNLSVASTATLQRTQAAAGPVAAIVLNGTAPQSVTSGLTAGTLNYTINNAAGVTLNNDITINGVLTFTSGKLTTGSNKIVVSSTGSISGGGTGWVIGNLQKAVAAAATAVSFEIGGTDAYRPVSLSFSTPVTTGGDITASVSQTAGDHPNISGSGLNANKSVNRYWMINNNGLVNADYAATITFDAADVDAGANTSNFIVKKYDGSAWSAPTTGTKTSTSIQLSETSALAASSQFAIGEASTLPVTISGFKGEVLASGNKLNWTTSTEMNNKGFEVERSVDGRTFSSIGFISSKGDRGNSSSSLSYSFDDLKPFAGVNYYRLKQVDNDGRSTTSSTISLARSTEKISITSVYPNPVTTGLTVVITSPKKKVLRMIISDMAGKIVVNSNMNIQSGANKQNINTSNLAPGTYTIKFVCAEGCETLIQHFIKQ